MDSAIDKYEYAVSIDSSAPIPITVRLFNKSSKSEPLSAQPWSLSIQEPSG